VRARSTVRPAAYIAAGGLLVAVGVAGTRASGQLELEFRPWLPTDIALLEIGLLVAAALCLPVLLLGMFFRRRARHDEAGGNLEWLRRLVVLAVLVASVVALRELLPNADQRDATVGADDLQSSSGGVATLWSGRTAVLAVVLAGTALGVLWWRAHAVRGRRHPTADFDVDRDRAAARAGRAVLDQHGDDPRAAVVGCYAAMEDELAAAGSARGRAETPLELLERAVAEGRLGPDPGRRLTELFLLARYSSAPVAAADVAAARQALRTIDAGAVQ